MSNIYIILSSAALTTTCYLEFQTTTPIEISNPRTTTSVIRYLRTFSNFDIAALYFFPIPNIKKYRYTLFQLISVC
jgi:hypothetical protein